MIALIVENKLLNTAFGIFDCTMQAGQGVTPFIMGYLLDIPGPENGYTYFFYFCLGIGVVQLLIAVFIWIYDTKNGNKLE